MIRKEKAANRQQIISEYLSSDQTYESLSEKHGVNGRTIQSWVRCYKLNNPAVIDPRVHVEAKSVKALTKELDQALIKNELLEEMLRLAEEHTKIDLRKKFGAKQS
jgi:transposase-like protein